MWLERNRTAQLLKDNGMTVDEVANELRTDKRQLVEILEGRRQANRRQAQALLNLFGIWSVCWAMKYNRRWMPYATEATAH